MRTRYPELRTEIETRCPAGHAQVLRCHPLRIVDRRPHPFPTLFWLACPSIGRAIGALEHRGIIRAIEARLLADPALAKRVERDHADYVAEREARLEPEERRLLERFGLLADFHARGIGGIRNATSVKCLHLHYAHHLARGSVIGQLIEQAAAAEGMKRLAPCAAVEVAS